MEGDGGTRAEERAGADATRWTEQGQKQKMDQIQDLGMCLWEEWENQHGGQNAGRPLVTSWGWEGKEDGAVSRRRMCMDTADVPCAPHQGTQRFGKALPVSPVPGAGGACLLLAREEEEVPTAQPGPGQRASQGPPGNGAWEDLLQVSFPRMPGAEIIVLRRR